MSGRSPREAVEASVHRLQVAVSCVSQAVFRVSPRGHDDHSKVHALLLNDGKPTPLKVPRGRPKLLVAVKMQYRLVEDAGPEGAWKVRTAAYQYRIETNDGQEVIGFHWHPNTASPTTYPHIHLGSVVLRPDGVLDNKDHVPTGRVALQAVLRYAIDLGAVPVREDWQAILTQTEAEFRRERSWH